MLWYSLLHHHLLLLLHLLAICHRHGVTELKGRTDLTGIVIGNWKNLSGNLTGHLTGDLSGRGGVYRALGRTARLASPARPAKTRQRPRLRLTGDLTGRLVGDLTGDLTGSLTGSEGRRQYTVAPPATATRATYWTHSTRSTNRQLWGWSLGDHWSFGWGLSLDDAWSLGGVG